MKISDEDLYFKRKLFPELVRLAWPIAVSMLSFSLMTVVDTLFVGQLGAAALAATAWGGVVAFTLLCFGLGGLRSIKVQISQSVGAGRPDIVGEVLTAGLVLAAILGVVAVGAGYPLRELVRAGSPSPEVASFALSYFSVRTWGAPAVLVATALREAQYGLGDSRSPMRAALVANLANIPLNAALIFGIGLGVQGAALATVAAQVIELSLLAQGLRGGSIRLGSWQPRRCRELARIGAPLGAELLLDMGAFTALAAVVASMGEVALAAHQIAIQLGHIAFLPAIAIGEATSVLAGQAVGRAEDRLVSRVARGGLLLNLGYVGACGLFLLFAAPIVARGFTPDAAVQDTAALLVRVSAGLTFLFSAYAVPRAVLRTVGSERFTAMVTVGAAWFITLPVAYGLGIASGWGVVGAWLGLYLEVLVGLVILWGRLGGRSWLQGARLARARLALEHPNP